MNQNESYPPPRYGPNRPPLRRDRRGGMLTGVCAGIGRYLDLDPVIFRILFAVLSIGGLGIVIYLIAWLLIPADDGSGAVSRSVVDDRGLLVVAIVAILLLIGAGSVIRVVTDSFSGTVPLLLAAIAVLAYLLWRTESHGEPRNNWQGSNGPAGPGPGYGWDAGNGPRPAQPWWQRPVPTYPPTGTGFASSSPDAPGQAPFSGGATPGGATPGEPAKNAAPVSENAAPVSDTASDEAGREDRGRTEAREGTKGGDSTDGEASAEGGDATAR